MSRTQPSAMYKTNLNTKSHAGGVESADFKQVTIEL